MPYDQGAGLGHQQHRKSLAECAFIYKDPMGEFSIPAVQPWCAKTILSFYFECMDRGSLLSVNVLFLLQKQSRGCMGPQ